MKYRLSILLGAICLIGCQSTKEPTLQEVLSATANEVNKTTPQMIDKDTRLDSSYALENKFVYKYTMVNYSLEQLEPNKFHDAILEQVTSFVCTSPDMKFFVDNKVQVGYSYYDKSNKFVTEAVVVTADCGKI